MVSNVPPAPSPIGIGTSNPPATPIPSPPSVILQTRLHRAHDLLTSESLAHVLTTFINEGYATSSIYPDTHWDHQPIRLKSPSEIHEMLGSDGMVAAVYHIQPKSDQIEPVAAASISRWHGDMDGVCKQDEEGWEVKAVTTKSGWGRRGLVGRCIETMMQELIVQEKQKGGHGEEKVRLWLHAVEEVNGDYWRRRGWKYVRGFNRPLGYWGSKFGFRLSVLLKEVDVQ